MVRDTSPHPECEGNPARDANTLVEQYESARRTALREDVQHDDECQRDERKDEGAGHDASRSCLDLAPALAFVGAVVQAAQVRAIEQALLCGLRCGFKLVQLTLLLLTLGPHGCRSVTPLPP